MSIDRLLLATVKAGGRELRLIPGRRLVIVTDAGEREVQGAEQSPAAIEQLLAPVLPAHARDGLARGRVQWSLDVAGVGPLQAWAERREGAIHAGFVFNGAAAASPAVPSTAPPPV